MKSVLSVATLAVLTAFATLAVGQDRLEPPTRLGIASPFDGDHRSCMAEAVPSDTSGTLTFHQLVLGKVVPTDVTVSLGVPDGWQRNKKQLIACATLAGYGSRESAYERLDRAISGRQWNTDIIVMFVWERQPGEMRGVAYRY